MPRFRLGNLLGQLDDPVNGHRSALLSFVWYLGGLTCVPGRCGLLKVPNKTARTEILQEARRFFNWLPDDPAPYREAVAALFSSTSSVQALCTLVQKYQLEPLKDNQVKHNNEAAVLQAFMAACILPFASADGAEPEFRVDPHQASSGTTGAAIDLVITKGGLRVAIELKNVKAWHIMGVPGGLTRPFANFKAVTWQQQTAWSQALLSLDDDAVWNCRVLAYEGATTQQSLTEFVDQEKAACKRKYTQHLQDAGHGTQLHAVWLVCRLGLHRLVWSQVQLT
jgi:hypothetical protein